METLEEIESTLDDDPIDIEVFKEGASQLTRQKDWSGLAAFYVRQLRRVDDLDEDEIKYHLWHQLGQIYELRLEEPAKAEQAYQVAFSLDPNDELEAKIIAIQERLE